MNNRFVAVAAMVLLGGGVMAAEPMDISKIDKNFRPATVDKVDVHYFNALNHPAFAVEGFGWREPGGELYRIPKQFTEKEVNKGVLSLATHTSGGVVRFRTDSPYVTLRSELRNSSDMNHMPRSGSAGFDIYQADEQGKLHYNTTVQPGTAHIRGQILERKTNSDARGKLRDWAVFMPLYGGVKNLEIGVAPGSKLEAPTPHRIAKPVVFYGSSITQGGCASRPANNYTTMLCLAVDAPQINLGFSGSAKGEAAMAEAIAGLEMAAFVLDYDYNAPSLAHLQRTHEPFFQAIRAKHPDLPVIMLSKCSWVDPKRRDIIRKTYENALAKGDKNVYFIDGAELFGEVGQDYCTVDRCHPNDLGFYQMYRRVLPELQKALQAKK